MILISKDTFKQNFTTKHGTLIILFSGLVLLMIIVSSILSLNDYDEKTIAKRLAKNVMPTIKSMNAYVRLTVLFTVIGNTLVLGGFASLVWWAMHKKKFGLFFGGFWGFIFLANAISFPFYSSNITWSQILSAIFNLLLAILMIIWEMQLLAMRSRIKQAMAIRKK